jgi:hypothetical protein
VTQEINKQIRLASRPVGWVSEENFTITEEPVPDPADGEVVVRNVFMSVDPYMRGRMNDVKSYIPPFQIGEVLQAGVVGQVVTSNFEGIAEGDYVMGMLGWENYSVSDGRLLRKIPGGPVPLSYHLGILGMPGMTGENSRLLRCRKCRIRRQGRRANGRFWLRHRLQLQDQRVVNGEREIRLSRWCRRPVRKRRWRNHGGRSLEYA